MGETALKYYAKMFRVSASSWGLRYPALKLIYRGNIHGHYRISGRIVVPQGQLSACVLPTDMEVVRCGQVDSQRDDLTPRELGALMKSCLNEAYSA
ncbi:hypothetical protein EVAR_78070_1 [Eumeta japonica]|uniref:Uncharacterized protein n=1 Tax=Eumeta variegata TaxID=151549 RepID=A0A4C1T171_EUMVA|nr:hypothetical protein EVAR_78070_1 [Eumeta japonica]